MKRPVPSPNSAAAGQMIRYGSTGVALAALYAAIYWISAVPLALPAQLGNAAGFLAALLVGYVIHSRWTFRGLGQRGPSAWGRFVTVNIAGYLLNCFWVWLVVQRLGQSVPLSILPIVTVTPAFMFLVNRRWTFG